MLPTAQILPANFATIAVLDLETCNLPSHNNNKTAITELCIYAFAADLLNFRNGIQGRGESMEPTLPRVLNKLTMLFYPNMMVDPETEKITGLSNYILEQESTFDDNAAVTVLAFLQHLRQPICLVAHNGWSFDFPIVKMSFDKVKKVSCSTCRRVSKKGLKKSWPPPRNGFCHIKNIYAHRNSGQVCFATPSEESWWIRARHVHFTFINYYYSRNVKDLPENIVCVDSLRAFLEIDKYKTIETPVLPLRETTILEETPKKFDKSEMILETALSEDSEFNWRQFNESTPKRPSSSSTTKAAKRRLLSDCTANLNASDEDHDSILKLPLLKIDETPVKKPADFKSRRSLNFGADASPVFKKYPPRGVYKLESMFKRIFKNSESVHAHHAEADVEMLVKLILYYGEDFMAYAHQHAKPLSEVPRLGRY